MQGFKKGLTAHYILDGLVRFNIASYSYMLQAPRAVFICGCALFSFWLPNMGCEKGIPLLISALDLYYIVYIYARYTFPPFQLKKKKYTFPKICFLHENLICTKRT